MKKLLLLIIFIIYIAGCKEEVTVTQLLDPVPTVNITSIQNNQTIVENTVIRIEAVDDIEIIKLELYINGKTSTDLTFDKSPVEFIWNTENITDGSVFTFYAAAYDNDGNISKTEDIKVTVRKMQPERLTVKFNSDTAAVISWQDNCKFESGFEIQKSTDSINFSTIQLVDRNLTSINVSGIYLQNTKYYFRIRAITDSIKSSFTDAVFSDFKISAPENLLVTNTQSPVNIKLSWSPAEDNFPTKFEIEQRTGDGNFNKIYISNYDDTEYLVENIDISKDNFFRIKAVTKHNSSEYSNTVQHNFISLNAPSNLKAEFDNDKEVKLTWDDNEPNEDGFEIESSADGVIYYFIKKVNKNVESQTLPGNFKNNNTYFFRVRAVLEDVKSNYSNIASNTISIGIPLNFKLETGTTPNSIKLLWQPNSTIPTNFEIQQKINNDEFETIAATTSNSYIVNNILPVSTYYFRVRALTEINSSNYTNSLEYKYVPLNKPKDLQIDFISDAEVKIDWDDNNQYETGFEIEISTDGKNFDKIKSVAQNVESTNIPGIYLKDKNYYFRIRALAGELTGDYSDIKSSKFEMRTPTDLKYTVLNSESIKLEWKSNSDISVNFELEQKIGGGSFSRLATTNNKEYQVNNIQAGIEYSFRVKSVSQYNETGFSNTSSYIFVPVKKFGTVKIYQYLYYSSNLVNSIDLSTGSAYVYRSGADEYLNRIDLILSSDAKYIASPIYIEGSTKKTYFKLGNDNKLDDGRDAPAFKEKDWENLMETKKNDYFFIYDNDEHYSKMIIKDSGGNGTYWNPKWIEVDWYYNTVKNNTKF